MTFILNSVPYIFVDTGPLTSDIATSEKIELVLIVSKSVSAARLPESLNTPRTDARLARESLPMGVPSADMIGTRAPLTDAAFVVFFVNRALIESKMYPIILIFKSLY